MKTKGKSKPETLIIGPMRTGTSWTYEYLKSRDDIILPKGVKETFFFDEHYEKGEEWYTSHFKGSENMISMEVGSSYFHAEKAPRRILHTLGKIPIIIIKRNPVDRSYSHFKHLVRYGYTSDEIHTAIKEYPEIISASQYDHHINRWQETFGEEYIHLLNFNLIGERPRQFLEILCSKIGISYKETSFSKEEKINEGKVVKDKALNKIATAAADALRAMKIYSIINAAKSIGLKKAVYGGKSLDEDKEAAQVKEIIKRELKEDEAEHV